MENFFKLKENGTTVRSEITGGITTFLAMAYIIAVNAIILSEAGMPKAAVITATCLTAGISTILMGVIANLPLALASGMGLNAFFAYTVCIGMNIPWEVALTAVFIEGIIFIILSLTKVREAVANCIPTTLKLAVTAGIGLFIAFIGFVNAGMVITDPATKVKMGNFTDPTVVITLIGILVIVVFYKKNVKGAILIGMVTSTVLAWIYAAISPETAASYMIFRPTGNPFGYTSIGEIAGKIQWDYLFTPSKLLTIMGIVITFLFVDFFDTLGTLLGVATKANLFDKEGKVKNGSKALLVDSIGTTMGAVLGTSTVTTYVESSAGVAEGARTGLASVVTGILFLVAMFLSPLFMAIPSCATAPALIIVGFFMIGNVVKINFDDFTEGVPAFLTIALMPLTYSIGDGLSIGILSYGVINFISNLLEKDESNKKKVSPIIYILAILFIIKLVYSGLKAKGII
ncbi:NCS2 family permease [Clostridium sediminicola]|uniref:NCS2 family permease n=1 Tax=Clostridium sediminicola TaxID=3114879 RepID=UPI0031F23771